MCFLEVKNYIHIKYILVDHHYNWLLKTGNSKVLYTGYSQYFPSPSADGFKSGKTYVVYGFNMVQNRVI